MPDHLFHRAKVTMAKRGVIFRELVVDALEQALEKKQDTFVLREASAGYAANPSAAVTSREINRAIENSRYPELKTSNPLVG